MKPLTNISKPLVHAILSRLETQFKRSLARLILVRKNALRLLTEIYKRGVMVGVGCLKVAWLTEAPKRLRSKVYALWERKHEREIAARPGEFAMVAAGTRGSNLSHTQHDTPRPYEIVRARVSTATIATYEGYR